MFGEMNFTWFGKRDTSLPDPRPLSQIADLGLDFHSHLLPGVDDGMLNFEQSKSAILELKTLGFTGAVLTPHLHKNVFLTTKQSLQIAFDEFRFAVANDHLDFQLYLSPEYFVDEHFLRLIESDDLLYFPINSENWVLVEFPILQEPPFAGACLSALVARGYRPVIAHVERYRFVERARDLWLARFANYGAVLQGDLGSLVGQHGDEVRKFALWLERQGRIDLWGSDLHKHSQIESYVRPGLRRLKRQGAINPLLNGISEALAP
jgi:tyrosine-protein phosphatase YwqE